MSTEQFIRDSAHRGLSKTQCREALGVSRETFTEMLKYLGELPWPTKGNSLGNRLANEARRGYCSPKLRNEIARINHARRTRLAYTARGVTGNIPTLIKVLNAPVSARTVHRRLAKGMSLEEALFTPGIKPFQGPNHRVAWH